MANELANTNNTALSKPMGITSYLNTPAIKANIANVVGEKKHNKVYCFGCFGSADDT